MSEPQGVGLGRHRCGAARFDAVFRGPPNCSVREEIPADAGFLDELSIACSPFSGLLPEAVIRQQAELQRIGQAASCPAAMRRIVRCDDRLAGRLMIDWGPESSHCVDVSVLPELQGNGIATSLLEAWIAVAEELGLSTSLIVRRDNPAIALYRKLGFAGVGDATGPLLAMSRAR